MWDSAVLERAAALLAEDLHDSALAGDLYRALEGAMDRDGYAIARELDRMGWEIDADLVEDLDGGRLDDAVDEAVEAWILAEKIHPTLGIGAEVVVDVDGTTGRIYRVDAQRGTYAVQIPSRGHVAEGSIGTQGVLLAWEDVETLQVAHAARPADAPESGR